MKVTANLSFAGAELAMFRGEVRDVPEYIADPLLKCGYLAVVEPAAANSSEMTKNELIQKAESMRPCDLTAADIAFFSRKIIEPEEYGALSSMEQSECEGALSAAKAAAGAYTGLDMEKTELEDLAYAVKVMAAEMIDNRQITAQYTGKNPMVMQILDLHITNLLPSEG